MNKSSTLKADMNKENLIIYLVIFLIVCSFFLLRGYKGKGAYWAVLEPGEVTLIGVKGSRITIQGDYQMDTESIKLLKAWLQSNDFQQDQAEKEPGKISYRGTYKQSLPIKVTLETKKAPEATKIYMSYHGSGFGWFLDREVRMAEVFSNELAKQCAKGTIKISGHDD